MSAAIYFFSSADVFLLIILVGNIMLKTTLILSLLLLSAASQASEAQCQRDPAQLSAQYLVSDTNQLGQQTHTSLQLFRHGSNVAYQYKDQAISEYWHQQTNGAIALTRYFDNAQRAIEYQASEVNKVGSWQQINEIISPKLRAQMQLIASQGQGCELEQEWHLTQGKQEIHLVWLANVKLIKQLTIQSRHDSKTWQLQTLNHSIDEVSQQFAQWQRYQSTDYADIGDNESDPFFSKMINLGFVEHAASGFYQADGQPLAGGHHH